MNINFELFKVFITVADEKSISKGASKLMISQPAVTMSIKTLEEELGGSLFIRTPKGVILTNEGKELYSYIKEGMNYFINGTNKFSTLKKLEEGTLNIGSTSIISETILIPYLEEFHKKYPNIKINITNDLTDNLIKRLRNGSCDIIITGGPLEIEKDITYKKLIDLNDIFVGGKEYKNKTYDNTKEILKDDILTQYYPSVTRINFNKFLSDNKLSCTPKMEVASHHLLTSLTEANFGIGVLTKEFIKEKLNKTLFEIKTDKKIPKRILGYATKTNSIPSFTTTKFIELLEKE